MNTHEYILHILKKYLGEFWTHSQSREIKRKIKEIGSKNLSYFPEHPALERAQNVESGEEEEALIGSGSANRGESCCMSCLR